MNVKEEIKEAKVLAKQLRDNDKMLHRDICKFLNIEFNGHYFTDGKRIFRYNETDGAPSTQIL